MDIGKSPPRICQVCVSCNVVRAGEIIRISALTLHTNIAEQIYSHVNDSTAAYHSRAYHIFIATHITDFAMCNA